MQAGRRWIHWFDTCNLSFLGTRIRTLGDTMGIIESLKKWLFGCEIATVEQIKCAVDIALANIDEDKDGYVSVGEFIKYVKMVLDYGRNRV